MLEDARVSGELGKLLVLDPALIEAIEEAVAADAEALQEAGRAFKAALVDELEARSELLARLRSGR